MTWPKPNSTVPAGGTTFPIHDIAIGKGALALPKIVEPFKAGKILMVFDNHTYKAAGESAVALMKDRRSRNCCLTARMKSSSPMNR